VPAAAPSARPEQDSQTAVSKLNVPQVGQMNSSTRAAFRSR
jgi:hypothetical protein